MNKKNSVVGLIGIIVAIGAIGMGLWMQRLYWEKSGAQSEKIENFVFKDMVYYPSKYIDYEYNCLTNYELGSFLVELNEENKVNSKSDLYHASAYMGAKFMSKDFPPVIAVKRNEDVEFFTFAYHQNIEKSETIQDMLDIYGATSTVEIIVLKDDSGEDQEQQISGELEIQTILELIKSATLWNEKDYYEVRDRYFREHKQLLNEYKIRLLFENGLWLDITIQPDLYGIIISPFGYRKVLRIENQDVVEDFLRVISIQDENVDE